MDDFSYEALNTADLSGIHLAKSCNIKVLGVGGGGVNSLQHMINQSLSGVEFIAVNTDSQALNRSTAPLKVQIGVKLTNGLGAGMDPNKGRKAAEESREDIKKLLQGSDLVFVTAGMGGGTGTGAAPVIASIAKESGALTIAVVTRPFSFEGKRHKVNAEAGITELAKNVDSLIIIENDKLLKNLGQNVSISSAFSEANDVLLNAVKGITDSIHAPGFINLDFSDVKTIMRDRGRAMIGNGTGQGANFIEDAVQRAIHSPLIEQVDIRSATGLLVNARVNPNFPINKWEQINSEIQNYADEEADCKYGIVFDDQLLEDQIAITILITGFSGVESKGADNNSAIARTSASIRRGSSANTGSEHNFFKLSQQGQMGNGGVVNMQSPANAHIVGNNNTQAWGHSHQAAMPNNGMANMYAAQGQVPMGAQAMQYNANSSELNISSDNGDNDNWEVPAIFRNKV